MSDDSGYRPAYERAVDALVLFIAEQGLRPGDRLPTELELAATLGTSQRAVREAVKMLSGIGRVNAQRGRGLFVGQATRLLGPDHGTAFRPTDLDQIRMLFQFRATQEGEIARLAAERRTHDDLEVLEEAVEDGRRSQEEDDQARFTAADERFHLGLAAASHNLFFVDVMTRIRSMQSEVSFLELGARVPAANRAVREHAEILRAVRDGSSSIAGERAARHVFQSLNDYRDAMADKLTF